MKKSFRLQHVYQDTAKAHLIEFLEAAWDRTRNSFGILRFLQDYFKKFESYYCRKMKIKVRTKTMKK